ncbi:TPA: alpha-1/alpha-2 family phenol-soluble modulin [Staphylococcus aureus]|nr:alpha-1/alpha-2 family phenol-soluble modulin [Staphylococcus aureus]
MGIIAGIIKFIKGLIEKFTVSKL